MHPRTLLGRIIRSAAVGVFSFVVVWTGGTILWLYAAALLDIENQADRQSREVSVALGPLVWNLDDHSIVNYLMTKVEDPEILSIEIVDSSSGHRWSICSPEAGPCVSKHCPGAPVSPPS